MKKQLRLGSGSGFWGDALDPAVEVLEQGLQKATATKTENAELAANIYADNADLREELDATREQITSLHQAMAQLVRKVSAAEIAEPPPVLVEL